MMPRDKVETSKKLEFFLIFLFHLEPKIIITFLSSKKCSTDVSESTTEKQIWYL